MKHYFLSICFLFIAMSVISDDTKKPNETKLLTWFSEASLDAKTKRKFEAKFKIKLGDLWKNEKPEILIKTLDADECIQQVSDIVQLKGDESEVVLDVWGLKEFKTYRLCIRTKTKVEYFKQTYLKNEKEPIKEPMDLEDGQPNVTFFKAIEPKPVGKSVSDCKLTGIVLNAGSAQAKMIRVKGTILDALSNKIKDLDFLLEQDKKPVILDGGDKFKIDRIEGGMKGFAGGSFSISWDPGAVVEKEIPVDNAASKAGESVFEYGKVEGDVQITKIVTKVINKTDLSLTVTIYNGLDKAMFNPVITIKLVNEKGELIQPITTEFEGELASKEPFEFTFEHKNAPPFSGIVQSIKYGTKK